MAVGRVASKVRNVPGFPAHSSVRNLWFVAHSPLARTLRHLVRVKRNGVANMLCYHPCVELVQSLARVWLVLLLLFLL